MEGEGLWIGRWKLVSVAEASPLWRTFTTARPGEPGDETWGGFPLELRGGGDAWITGSYALIARLTPYS